MLQQVGIRAIGAYIPATFLSNYARKEEFDITDDFIENKIGVRQVARKAADESTSNMCVKAFADLAEKVACRVEQIDCIVVCTQNPDGHGIPHTSANVHAQLGLGDDCAAFDISLGCSGYVYGLSIVKSFMEANGLKNGLLFTADPYSKVIDPADKDTVLLFGDAATVTLLSSVDAGETVWKPAKFLFASRGKQGDALHNKNGVLTMNGRAIFNFAAVAVPVQVRSLLEAVGVAAEEVDLFLFHQGSKYIVDTIQKRLGIPADKVPAYLSEQGNAVSSSLPLLLNRHLNDAAVNRMVLSGFGVGLSWASCMLEREKR